MSVFLPEQELFDALECASSIVEFVHMPHHNHRRFLLLQRIIYALQKREVVAIVWVGEPHIAPIGSSKPRVACRRKPAVFLVRHDTNTRIGIGKALRHRQAIVRRAIIHRNSFPIGEQLVLQVEQSISQIRLRVVRGQDYGEEGGKPVPLLLVSFLRILFHVDFPHHADSLPSLFKPGPATKNTRQFFHRL